MTDALAETAKRIEAGEILPFHEAALLGNIALLTAPDTEALYNAAIYTAAPYLTATPSREILTVYIRTVAEVFNVSPNRVKNDLLRMESKHREEAKNG